MLRFAPGLAHLLLIGSVAAGLAGTVLPAFGYLPVLGADRFGLAAFEALFATPGLGISVALALASGLVTTAVSVVIVIALVAGWWGTPSFARLRHLVSPLLSIPHAAAAFGLAFLIAPSGWLMRLFSPWATGLDRPPDLLIVNDAYGLAMMAGLVGKEVPFLLLMVIAALPQTKAAHLTQVTSSLGYGRVAGWMKAVFPQVYRQIRLPVLAVVAYASSVVDVALILGPTTPAPLAVRLVGWMGDPDIAMRFKASAGALLQLGVTGAALLGWLLIEWLVRRIGSGLFTDGRRMADDRALRGVSLSVMVGLVAVSLAGMGVVALWSVAGFWRFPDALPDSFSLNNWSVHLGQSLGVLNTTLVLAAAAVVVALGVALATLENQDRRRQRPGAGSVWLIYVPLLVPQVAFLFGLNIVFLWLGIAGSAGALLFVHVIFVLPYVLLSLSDPWAAWDRRYAMVAGGLGIAPAGVFWRVRLPMLLRAVLTAGAVGFAVSIGQYLPTLLIGGGRWPTITTEAVALASGGNRQIIAVYAVLQMALPFIGFGLAMLVPDWLYRSRRALKGPH
ncbi:MAG: ABC transporter permease [Hyphomicrobiales bacterium]